MKWSRLFTLDKNISKSQATMFRSKITDIVLDPVNRAIFSASQPAIDWEVISKRLCVLIDTSGDADTDDYIGGIKMQWVFRSLMSYIRRAGRNRQFPISIYIDELSSMYEATDNLLSRDINLRQWHRATTLANRPSGSLPIRGEDSEGSPVDGNTDNW